MTLPGKRWLAGPVFATATRTDRSRSHDGANRALTAAQLAVAVGLAATMVALTAFGYGAPAILCGYAGVFVALLDPPTGLAVLVLLIPFREPAGFGPMGFYLVLATGILLGCLARLPRDRPLRLELLWAVLLGFGAFATLQVLATPSDFLGQQMLSATLQLAGLAGGGAVLLAAQHLLRTRDPGPYLDLAVISGSVVAGLAVASEVSGGAVQAALSSVYGIGLLQDRAIGTFSNANYFGLFAVTTLLVAIQRASFGAPWRRALTAGAAALISVAVLLSFSRGALLAAAFGVIALAFSRNKRTGIAAICLCLVTGILLYGSFSAARFAVTNPTQSSSAALLGQQSSDEGRLTAGLVGFQLFRQDPIFGIGFGQYHFVSPRYLAGNQATYSHDWYVNVLAEQGLVGISLMALAAVLVAARVRRSTPARRGLAVSMLCAYAVGCLFTEAPGQLQTSGVAWLVVGAALASTATPAFSRMSIRRSADQVSRPSVSTAIPTSGRRS
jgi:O-antigen ligase